LVPEVISEQPLSGLHGLGGAIQNFELQKQGSTRPQLYRSRTYLKQTFNFGGEAVRQESDPMQLGTVVQSRRLVLTAGNFSILDIFDKNSVSWDPRQTFMNMAFMTYASWDFPADARGYTYGLTAEMYWDDWVVRVGRILPPQNPNAATIDFRFWKFYGDQIEIEHDQVIHRRASAVRVLGYRNYVDAGLFSDAIAAFEANPAENAANCAAAGLYNYGSQNTTAPDLCWVRKPNTKLGIGLDLEQYFTPDIGMFFRGMYSDGLVDDVDRFHLADVDARPFQHPPQRAHPVGDPDRPRDHLRQHRLEYGVVLPTEEQNLDVLPTPEPAFQLPGRIDTREPTTDDDDPLHGRTPAF
jgi:high affinity Mn2+ porin